MNESNQLLKKFELGKQTWSDYSHFLKLDLNDLDNFFQIAYKIKLKNFGNILKCYVPNKKFPAISITGTDCALKCEHCNKKYLNGMKPIVDNTKLEQFLMKHYEADGIGALISGGCNSEGSVPLFPFLDTINKIKKKTKLIINTHTGLIDEKTAKKLAEVDVDILSFDITMDKEIIREIYHLDKDLEDYKKSIELFKKYKLNIVPHICVGLYYGKIHKELQSIKYIKKSGIDPSLIVIIVLIPPKNSHSDFEVPRTIDIAKVIAITRFIFPETEISLGCMRPRGLGRHEIEKLAVKAGITRIELPSKKTLRWIKKINPSIIFKFFSACCAIPTKYENLAESKEDILKKYEIYQRNEM